MTISYIKMKMRAGGGALGQQGGALGQQGTPPCYSSLWETLGDFRMYIRRYTFPNENFEYGYPHANALLTLLILA